MNQSANYEIYQGQYISKGKAESLRKRGAYQPVGGLGDPERKPDSVHALDKGQEIRRGCEGCLPTCLVTITSHRSRKLDSDNLVAGAKPLRDCISKTLGIDDGDDRIQFEYRQVITKGRPGTHVTITAL